MSLRDSDAILNARMAKAQRLATAFAEAARKVDPDLSDSLVADAADQFTIGEWQALAEAYGIREPSLITMEMTIDVLKARARADAAWRTLQAKLPTNPLDGLPQ